MIPSPMVRKIDLSHKTIFFIAGFLAFLWALYAIKDVILLIFVSFIFVSAFSPIVEYLVKNKVPRGLAIALVYVVVVLAMVVILGLGIVPFTTQTSSLIQKISSSVNNLYQTYPFIDQARIQEQLANVSRNI